MNQFERSLGRAMEWADFADAVFNTVIAAELARGITPSTVRGMRASMRALWNSAWWAEILDKPPGRIRKIKLKASLPQCWTTEELARLAAQIEQITGNLRSCPAISRKAFWKALVATAFYSGLRHGDLDALKWPNLRGDTLYVVMSKTGDMLSQRLPEDCLELLEPLRAVGTEFIFSDLLCRGEQDETFRRLLQAAGLPGSFKWLRRSGASHLERVAPGSAKGFLGHRTPNLAWRHYLDPAVVQQDRPIPPQLPRLDGGKDGAN
jgi:integrase